MKKILVSILVAIMFLSAFSFVNAGSASTDLTPSTTTVKKGDSFTVSLVTNAEVPVVAFQGMLKYDKTKLSLVREELLNDFSSYNTKLEDYLKNETGERWLEAGSDADVGSKSVQIYTMHFKALDNAAVGNTIISIEDIAIACEDTNVPYFTNNNVVGDSVTIEIKEPEVKDTTAPVGTIEYRTNEDKSVTATITFNESNVTITNNDGKSSYTFTKNGEFTFEFQDAAGNKGTATAKVTSIVEPPKDDNTTPGEGDLPQTGSEIITVMAVVALGAVSIISFSAYKRYKNI